MFFLIHVLFVPEIMAAKDIPKFDPNTEAFQMRAQWAKAENCRLMWYTSWSWLLDERK